MSTLNRGDSFEKAGLKWTVLEVTKCGYKCVAEPLKRSMQFGSSNKWKDSHIRKYLNGEFLKSLVSEVGEANIIPFERDLISLDGMKNYGTCTDCVSIPSFDEYRANRDIFPSSGEWCWTLTPDSAESNGDTVWVAVVASSGGIYYRDCGNDCGVRPVCIFDSSIFESEDE